MLQVKSADEALVGPYAGNEKLFGYHGPSQAYVEWDGANARVAPHSRYVRRFLQVTLDERQKRRADPLSTVCGRRRHPAKLPGGAVLPVGQQACRASKIHVPLKCAIVARPFVEVTGILRRRSVCSRRQHLVTQRQDFLERGSAIDDVAMEFPPVQRLSPSSDGSTISSFHK